MRKHSFTCSSIEVNDSESSDEKEFERSVFDDRILRVACKTTQQASDESLFSDSKRVTTTDNEQPGCSSGNSFIDEGIASLTTVFPHEGVENVREALLRYENVELAACALMSRASDTDQNTGEMDGDKDVSDSLGRLRAMMKSFMSAERLKVDEEDVVIDLLQYYKSTKFDPKIPISVRFRGQPGVDSGGLLRRAFTTAFEAIAQSKVPSSRLFTGQTNSLTPLYSSENLLTQSFKTLGKMVGHSLIQDGPGFPNLVPAIYWYIVTGDLNEAVARASHINVVDEDLMMKNKVSE